MAFSAFAGPPGPSFPGASSTPGGRLPGGAKMKKDADYFADQEPVLVYIAKRLKDALRLEGLLDAAGIEYGVEADEYRGGVVFQSARVGAFFYVLPETAGACRDAMRQNGYKPYEELAPPPAKAPGTA